MNDKKITQGDAMIDIPSIKKSYGQFFTPENIVNLMVDMLPSEKTISILEPSCGKGIFIDELIKRKYLNLDAYELDINLIKYPFVKNESFISSDVNKLYDVVIGNPPYVRWRNLLEHQKYELKNNNIWKEYFNSLCDYFYIFILKSILMLKENGSLIFICPDYWLSTTHASKLREFMIQNGYFKRIILFKENKVFNGVSSSIMIFHYKKKKNNDITPNIKVNICRKGNAKDSILDILASSDYFEIEQFQSTNWVIVPNHLKSSFSELVRICDGYKLGDVCDIGNGMVSGFDKAFQMPNNILYNSNEMMNSIIVHKAKNLSQYFSSGYVRYIFIHEDINEKELIKRFPNFYEHLSKFKLELKDRYNYNKDIPYWKWVFLRNYSMFSFPQKKIFVPCKERITHKQFFRFCLVEGNTYPTQDVTAIYRKPLVKESIEYILAYLNSETVFKWIKYNGIIKGGVVEFSENPLSRIPFRKINWDNKNEINLHNEIRDIVKNYIKYRQEFYLLEIRKKLNELGV